MHFNIEDEMYEKSEQYWKSIPATIDGMLGGFGFISNTDISGSKAFLKFMLKYTQNAPNSRRALDCGAGIGRITKNLLLQFFDSIDLLEPNSEFLSKAKEYIDSNKVERFINSALQEFQPLGNRKYDVIWCQWVLTYLTDDDLIKFLLNCKTCMKDKGLIIIKENISSSNTLEFDEKDSSFTRPHDDWLRVFKAAGFESVRIAKQPHFPKALFPVQMYAFKISQQTD